MLQLLILLFIHANQTVNNANISRRRSEILLLINQNKWKRKCVDIPSRSPEERRRGGRKSGSRGSEGEQRKSRSPSSPTWISFEISFLFFQRRDSLSLSLSITRIFRSGCWSCCCLCNFLNGGETRRRREVRWSWCGAPLFDSVWLLVWSFLISPRLRFSFLSVSVNVWCGSHHQGSSVKLIISLGEVEKNYP